MSGWLESIPTTPLRIVVTVLLTIGTAVRYLVWGIPVHTVKATVPAVPDTVVVDGWGYWLLFLCVMAGIDVAQYIGRRVSDYTYAGIKAGAQVPDRAISVTGPATVVTAPGASTINATPGGTRELDR